MSRTTSAVVANLQNLDATVGWGFASALTSDLSATVGWGYRASGDGDLSATVGWGYTTAQS
jgi:hypothetical protein